MRKLTSTMKWQHLAVVDLRSPIGLMDNFRYDRACPYSEEDANIIERFMSTPGEYVSCKVVVTCWGEGKNPHWTFVRWNCCGNQLRELGEYDDTSITRELVRRELVLV